MTRAHWSHFLRMPSEIRTAVRVVKNIGGLGDFLDKSEKIVRLVKILTIIKLLKEEQYQRTSLEFEWGDVN